MKRLVPLRTETCARYTEPFIRPVSLTRPSRSAPIGITNTVVEQTSRGLGFRVEDIALTSASLRAGAPPLRFAHLTDLHLRVFRKRHSRLIALIKERRPDFLCITGDIVSGNSFTWDVAAQLIPQLQCPLGVFACPGNHEAKSIRRPAAMKEMMAGWGVTLLINESRVLETPTGSVRVGGVDDLAYGWPSFDEAISDGPAVGNGQAIGNGPAVSDGPAAGDAQAIGDGHAAGIGAGADYCILLSHAPLTARLIGESSGVDLVLSGHTHGGQVRVPFLWPRILPSGHGGFPAGLYDMGWGHLYVNRGFGGSIWMPIRFRCPAEVAFFEVRPA